MRHATRLFTLAFILVYLTGCGGSSVDLPKEVMTEDAYAVQWIDFEAIDPDDGVKLLRGLSDDMSDDQPKATLWLSAGADKIDTAYRERWDAFTDAGCKGLLTVYYRVETTQGSGDNKRTDVKWQRHTFVKAGKDAKTDGLEEVLAPFAEEDGIEKVMLKQVGKDSPWYWLTREGAPSSMPEVPEGGDEKTAKAFQKLLDKGDGAPMVTAWRALEPFAEAFDEELKREDMEERHVEELKQNKAMETIVLACTPGRSAATSAILTFSDAETAKAYAKGRNEKLIEMRPELKTAMINTENPPHPDLIDELIDAMGAKQSGKSVAVTLGRGSLKDMLSLSAARMSKSMDDTAPAYLFETSSLLRVPSSEDVPGVRNCYEALKFGRDRMPQSRPW